LERFSKEIGALYFNEMVNMLCGIVSPATINYTVI